MKVGDGLSCWELNRRGVPQGSVLGPLLREAIEWFRNNSLMDNPGKFQLLVLGSTEQDVSFNIDGRQ